ncbi:hypothetical protein A5819_003602 [Enterococcus sp. 7E2_DIV0204]|uniref:hypothetical protein n=1 Tax=unclassified Enterococcus TaxID=2608891 RepID=UPI000A336C1F|nr:MULTISPECIES: hypothetical protein [unclassified Enterococcus]OTN84052.1 hypothetical protein A5819_003602 [Enterococcus sp. 7E2_DIV0204]OTP47260.1 hypothetical protein A5884_003635 [Enterococcus sp. 7D2_DIV0200]
MKVGSILPKGLTDRLSSLGKKGEAIVYYVMLFLTVSGLVFIVSSRQIFGDDSPIIDAGTGKKSAQSVGSSEVTVIEKQMNPKTRYGEVLLRIEQPVTQVGIKYETVVGENATKQLVTSKMTNIHDQYYLIQLENIPTKWKQLVVDFGYTSKEKPQINMNYLTDNVEDILKDRQEKTEQVTFIFDYRKMAESTDVKPKSTNQYIIKVTSLELSNVEKLMKKAAENRSSFEKEIRLLNEKMEELEQKKSYETKEQIKQLDQEINRVKSEINSYNQAIVELDKQTDSLEEKKQKLIERNRKSTYETEESN